MLLKKTLLRNITILCSIMISTQISAHNFPGMLCTIEGIDGSGKTTIIKNLQKLFAQTSINPIFTKEPGATALGQQLRRMILDQTVTLTPTAQFLLFAADRAQHFDSLIIPHLQQAELIISDRMADSSLAYQGYVKGVDLDFIKATNRACMHNIEPDLIFYVRINPSTARERIQKTRGIPDKFEETVLPKIAMLQAGFEEIFQDRNSVVMLDGTAAADELAQDIFDRIYHHFLQKTNRHA